MNALELSNMSMSYISTSTDVSTFHWSCHCQLVFNAGCQQPGQGSGAWSLCAAPPDAETEPAGARASTTRVDNTTPLPPRLMRSVSSLGNRELDARLRSRADARGNRARLSRFGAPCPW